MRVSETEMVIVDAGYDSLVPTRKLILKKIERTTSEGNVSLTNIAF